jgi:hypothetical protein
MPRGGVRIIMLAMNSAPTSPARLLLVADRRPGPGEAPGPGVRRFRLARLRVGDRPPAAAAKRG